MAQSISLMQFLIDNPVSNITEEIDIPRLAQAGYKVKISAMTGDQFQEYQKQATAIGRHKKVAFDGKLFNELVVINHTIDPNFKDANMIKAAGCTTPAQLMYKVLKAGEIQELSKQISSLSGFDDDVDSNVEEVKNS